MSEYYAGQLADQDTDWSSDDAYEANDAYDGGTSELGETVETPVTAEVPPAAVDNLPENLRFGAQIGPYGTRAESYAEDYYYSTTENAHIGEKSGREIDPWTDTAV